MNEQPTSNNDSDNLKDYTKNHPPLENELSELLNKHSCESGSDTPDYILAQYLMLCLGSFNVTTQRREEWYGRKLKRDEINGTPFNKENVNWDRSNY